MVQVQLRLTEFTIKEIDKKVTEGKFKSRSDAIKSMIEIYIEREKTREFYELLSKRSQEAKDKPEILVPFQE